MDALQQVLGELESIGLDETVGVDEAVGIDFGNYLNILSELAPAVAKAGGDLHKEATKGGDASKAIAADLALADARTDLGTAQRGKNQNKIAAAVAAVTASESAVAAATAGISPEGAKRRRDAAQAQLTRAVAGLKGKPNDAWWQARVPAWQSVLDSISLDGSLSLSPSPSSQPPATAPGGGSALDFLKRGVGPLPLYGWLLGAGAAVGGYILWKKRKVGA